ncbi:MAG: VanZ family protein [Proteobacteria bacterium]|nr:VanZ family protein [Pseudomonadota bacterium]
MFFDRLTHVLRRVLAWLFWPALAVVVWGELTPSPPHEVQLIWDKALHFTAYFGLALFATLATRASRNAIWAVLALALFGGVLEIVQSFVGRDPEIMDEIANIIGAVSGGLIGWVLVIVHDRVVGRSSPD